MIRKGILVSFLVLLSPLCFAQQRILNDIEFISGVVGIDGTGYFIVADDTEENTTSETDFSSINTSFTGGLGLVNYPFPNTDKVGIFLIYESYYLRGFIYELPDEKIFFNHGNITVAENYQIGVKLQFLQAGNFKFPFMVGYSVIHITAGANPSPGVTYNIDRASSGIFISAATELHFNKSIFLFARIQTTISFLASTAIIKYTEVSVNSKTAYYIEQRNNEEYGLYTTFTPVIGLGLKLNGLFSK